MSIHEHEFEKGARHSVSSSASVWEEASICISIAVFIRRNFCSNEAMQSIEHLK